MTKKVLFHENVVDIFTREKLPRSYSTRANHYVYRILEHITQKERQIDDILILWTERGSVKDVNIMSTPMTEEELYIFAMNLTSLSILRATQAGNTDPFSPAEDSDLDS